MTMDDILDKLKCLDYHREFCKPRNLPVLHRFYFMYPMPNPNEQLYYFSSLFGWLVKLLGKPYDTPGQFDDPNAIAATIASELKKLSVTFEYTTAKLKQAYGDVVLQTLQTLVDLVIHAKNIIFKKPIQRVDDYPEEAEVDADAEVVAEIVEEIEFHHNEEEEVILSKVKTEAPIPVPKIDPQEWKLEVERVSPLLKIALVNNNKDWRIHLQQMDLHEQCIKSLKGVTASQLQRIHDEIKSTLEQIQSREKYINSQFEPLIEQYKSYQEQISDLKQKYGAASSNVTELTNELSRISDELDSVKAKMDDLGNGMTDSKPLSNVKQGLTKLKMEMKQMDLRTGVIEHTLLHAKMTSKSINLNGFIYQ